MIDQSTWDKIIDVTQEIVDIQEFSIGTWEDSTTWVLIETQNIIEVKVAWPESSTWDEKGTWDVYTWVDTVSGINYNPTKYWTSQDPINLLVE